MPRRARQPTLPVDGSRISVLGLGYVGLPLALAFGKRFPTIGFDIDPVRVEELRSGQDRSLAVLDKEIYYNRRVPFTADLDDLRDSDVFIVTVPTPIDEHKRPDLTALKTASRMVGEVLEPGGLVIFESTVYPGATEEVCVPLLEEASGAALQLALLRRLQPRAAQSGRPVPPTRTRGQDHLGIDAADSKVRRCAVWGDHPSRDLSRRQHAHGRSRQDHREHPARPQHRAGQRVRHDLRPPRR